MTSNKSSAAMQVRTYRARSLKEALRLVQSELGPDARVVHTRELPTGWWERIRQGRQYEIRTRKPGPKPLPLRRRSDVLPPSPPVSEPTPESHETFGPRVLFRLQDEPLRAKPPERNEAVTTPSEPVPHETSSVWFELLSELIEAEIPESAARELMDAVRADGERTDPDLDAVRHRILAHLGERLPTGRGILVDPGRLRTVALVGPTGVGKTTTLAKLAANFRLRDQRRVGLITVDTYRIAAVEQLRTYAEIMDLPMEVVATPRQMSDAIAKFADLDLILIDTAGHSPHDPMPLQQLKSLLAEAKADEIHLVMSGVAATAHLKQMVRKFRALTPTSLIVTKLDEATGLGNLVPVLNEAALPISYLTCGQSVPDDIVLADKQKLLPVLVGQQPIASLI